MNLLFASDAGYWDYLLIAVDAALSSTSTRCAVHVITPGVADRAANELAAVCELHSASTNIVAQPDGPHTQLPSLLHLSQNAYLRLYAPELLTSVDRFLYLDCDLTVVDDLVPLGHSDLEGFALGAVPMMNSSYGNEFFDRHSISCSLPYFNSGVLFVDVKRWNQLHLTEKLFDWLQANQQTLTYADQDALNGLLANEYKCLPARWNCEARFFVERLMPSQDQSTLRKATSDPAVVHYTGATKPWSPEGFCPKRHLFWRRKDIVESRINRSLSPPLVRNRFSDKFRVGKMLARMHAGRVLHRAAPDTSSSS